MDFVEFVEINTDFNHPFFRDLTVELVSPAGAVSTLSTSAPIGGELTTEFRFGSARHLGENAAGEWTLRIKDLSRSDTGSLRSWGLTIYGHGFVPGEPEIDAVTPGGGTLEIGWKAPTDTGETAITSYDLRYIRDDATDRSDGNWSVETGVGTPSNRSYIITGLESGVKYEIQLRAHNDAGQGPWSQSEAEEPTTVAPSAPSISSVTRGDRSLGVVWTAPTNTGGGVITAYDVRYIETSEDETMESNWTVRDNAWTSGDLGYVISNLTNSTEYDVQVRAVNSAGDGAWSDTETGTPLPDDIAITLQWEETSIEVAEDAGSVVLKAVFTTTVDTAPEADFTFDVNLTTTDNGTTQGDDYTAPPSSATFVASDFSQTDVNGQQRYRATRDFTVVIIDDMDDESDETFNVTLAYATPGLTHLQGGPSTVVVTIEDNDHVAVTLGWQQTTVSANEPTTSGGTTTVTLRARAVTESNKQPETGFVLDYSVNSTNGSAVDPDDFDGVASNAESFVPGDFSRQTVGGQSRYVASQDFTVTIADDADDEPNETFTVTLRLSNSSLPHLSEGDTVVTVTINDNDHVPVNLSWEQSSFTVDEDEGTVTLVAEVTTEVDKMPESGFDVAVSVETVDDSASRNADFRPLSTTHRFRQSDFTRVDTGGGLQRYQATREFEVTVLEDTMDESNEQFEVVLSYSNPTLTHLRGSSAEATVSINDNDHVPVTLGWEETAFTAEEPTSPGTTTPVTLRAMAVTATDKRPESGFAFDFTVNTVNGTARQPDDYEQLTATGTFDRNDFARTMVDGQSRWVASEDFTVNVVHDTVDEPIERFTVRLAFVGSSQPHLILGDSTATVTTTDDVASLVDLRTTVNATNTVAPGEQLTYDWSVSNSGPAASTSTVLTGTLDAGTSFVSAQVASPATGQCRRSGQTVTCSLGTVGLSDTVSGEIVVEVKDNASADIDFTAIARADQLDRTPADNDDSVTTELVAAPRQITNLRASGASAHIDVTWSTPGDNGSPITRYELERKEAGEIYALVTPGLGVAVNTYRDSQVSAGTTYTYQLRAVNADGDAEWSNEATATARATPPPPPPPPITGGGGGGGFGPPPLGFVEGSSATRSVPENTPVGENVGDPVDATGEDLEYTLAGDDASAFSIVSGTGQLQTKAALDYETQASHTVTVTATDSSDASATIDVTINVDNVEEPGTVTLSSGRFTLGETIVATLTDPDGSITETTWLWERSLDKIAWTAIGGATSAEYTPILEDAGHYLRVTASYSDGEGPGKAASGISDEPVQGSRNPTGLRAEPGSSPDEVTLTWTPVADATARWVWSVKIDGTAGKWTAGQAGSAVVGDLETGVTYWFVVIEELGQRDGASQWSEYSNWSQSGPRTQRNPTGLAAEPGNNPGEVALTWTPVADATAHWIWSVKIDGTDGKWTAGQAGSAVVGDLEAGQAYWFVVIEELGQQDGASQWSAYSNWDRAMASEQLNPTGVLQMSNNSYRANWSWR